MNYRLTWHLVLVRETFGTLINSVFGGALLECAQKRADELGGEVRSLSGYGMPFHAGETFKG